jgi:hypothetical protein
MRRRVILWAAGPLAVASMLTACSSSGSTASARPALTLEDATDWYANAAEVALPCQESSKAVDDALDATAASTEKSDTNLAVMLAAGQAVENCTIAPDSEAATQVLPGMDEIFPEGTSLLRQWIDAAAQTGRAALLAAATNLDSRRFVGALFDDQRRADDLAQQFEDLVATTAASLGVDPPTGETLYHWNPPEH